MGVRKSDFTVYLSQAKGNGDIKPADIVDLIKKNKKEEKKEKVIKIYTTLGFVGVIFLLGIFIYI